MSEVVILLMNETNREITLNICAIELGNVLKYGQGNQKQSMSGKAYARMSSQGSTTNKRLGPTH